MTEVSGTQRYWEDFYRERPVWSGRPNALLVREVADLVPGTTWAARRAPTPCGWPRGGGG